jgi:hypothetical protein
MKTMKTQDVVQWFENQGNIDNSRMFDTLFHHLNVVDYAGIEGFFAMVYHHDVYEEMFRCMQCDVITTLTFEHEYN